MKTVKTISDLVSEAHENAVAHGFTDNEPAADVALFHSEASEVLEDLRRGLNPNELTYETPDVLRAKAIALIAKAEQLRTDGGMPKPTGVPSELADICIRVFHFAGKHRIDLERAIREKMLYNATRPFKHGKKF